MVSLPEHFTLKITMKILVADDHALFREGLRQVVHQLADEVIMLEAHNWKTALALGAQHPNCALALIDFNMPGMESGAGLKAFLQQVVTVPVVVVSASESMIDMKSVLDAGAMGYLAKSEATPVVLGALRLVLSGGVYVPPRLIQSPVSGSAAKCGALPFGLTPKQFEVLQIMVQGKSNKEIAHDFNLSEATVKAHIGAIFKALKVSNRLQAIRLVENWEMNSG